MNLNFTGRKKKMSEKKYSIIEINLFKPTKKSYPEFDYEKICKDYLKEDDSSGEDERFHDRAAEELVKRLNEKYGTKRDKKGRRLRFGDADDFMDKTVGYDLDDPFIDDTEAYDEQVPSTMDTAKGGFYVNKGKLDFRLKYVDDSDSEDEEPLKKKAAEKRRAISDDEQENEVEVSKASTSKASDVAQNGLEVEEPKKQESGSVLSRLSANGAPPMHKRIVRQNLIKRRRLIGQPPTMKLTPSPTVKAALGVKRKLKNPMKKVAGSMNEDDLDTFLKDMVGGQEIPFDETMRQALKDLKNDSIPVSKSSTSIAVVTTTPSTSDHEAATTVSASTSNEDLTNSPTKRGRPFGSATDLSKMIMMSPKLTEMIETYKKRTSEFGAPTKKIRLPPSLVDLCIKIEHQCNSDNLSHAQKTRIFDSLASWVLVQRNSLYIRMKMQKEKHEAVVSGAADNNTSSGVCDLAVAQASVSTLASLAEAKNLSNTLSTPTSVSALLVSQNASENTSDTSVAVSPAKSNTQSNTVPKINQIVESSKLDTQVPKTTAVNDIGSQKATQASVPKTSILNGAQKVVASAGASSPVRQTPSVPSAKKNVAAAAPQMPVQQAQLINALAATNNTQMLALMSAILQQQQAVSQNDAQQQRQLAAALTALKMQSVLAANACQSPELLRQYQLLMSNLSKSSPFSSQSVHSSANPSASQGKQFNTSSQQSQAKQSMTNSVVQIKPAGGVTQMTQGKSSTNVQSTLSSKQANSNLLKNLQKMNKLDDTFRCAKNTASFKAATSVMKNVVVKSAAIDSDKAGSSPVSASAGSVCQTIKPHASLLPKQHSRISDGSGSSVTQISKPSSTTNTSLNKSFKTVSDSTAGRSVKAGSSGTANSRQSKDSNQRNVMQPMKLAPKPSSSVSSSSASQVDKTKALELINTAAELLSIAVEEAIALTDASFEPPRKKSSLENASSSEKKFVWTDKLRLTLKTLVNTFSDSLNAHLPHSDLNSKLAQYLYGCIHPLFKGYIPFKELHDELVKLVPERLYLFALPEMKEYCKERIRSGDAIVATAVVQQQQNRSGSKITAVTQPKDNVSPKTQRTSPAVSQSNIPTIKPKSSTSVSATQVNRTHTAAQPENRQKIGTAVSNATENQA